MFLYSAVSSQLDRSKRFTLLLPWQTFHHDNNSASPGCILAMQQLRATTKSFTFRPLSIGWYSFIQLSQQGRQWRERKCPVFETVAKGDLNPGSLECESGVVPLSYRAPHRGTHNGLGPCRVPGYPGTRPMNRVPGSVLPVILPETEILF